LSLSIGTIVSTQLQTAYINPENLSPGEIVSKNERYFSKEQVEKLSTLPNIFLILGFTAAALQAISILMIFEKKSDRKSMSFFNRKKKKTKEEQERADKADDKQKAEIAEIMNDRHPNSIGIE
jgi:DNA-binding transcriptional MerR regulator